MNEKYNFVAERVSEEDKKFLETFDIRNVYWGGNLQEVSDWSVDREKGIYYILNSCPGQLQREGIYGPNCDNLIYKEKVNVIAYEYDTVPKEKKVIYSVKQILIDESLEGCEEEIKEAFYAAIITYKKATGFSAFFEDKDLIYRYEKKLQYLTYRRL